MDRPRSTDLPTAIMRSIATRPLSSAALRTQRLCVHVRQHRRLGGDAGRTHPHDEDVSAEPGRWAGLRVDSLSSRVVQPTGRVPSLYVSRLSAVDTVMQPTGERRCEPLSPITSYRETGYRRLVAPRNRGTNPELNHCRGSRTAAAIGDRLWRRPRR